MKKLVALCLFAILIMSTSQAFANLDDTRASMAARYGDYRMVVDEDGHLWTKADWESGSSSVRASDSTYVYYFTRNGLDMQMEVQYQGNKPDSRVTMQRITPDSEIKIQDFKTYFPEVYALTVAPKAQIFTTRDVLTRNFQSGRLPLTLGVVVGGIPARTTYSTLVAFNVQGPGQLIRNPKDISKDLYIHEFTIERIDDDGLAAIDRQTLKSPF